MRYPVSPRASARRASSFGIGLALVGSLLIPGVVHGATPVRRPPVPAVGPHRAVATAQAPNDRLIVRYRHGATASQRANARGRVGGTLDRRLGLIGGEVIHVRGDLRAAATAVAADPAVLSAEPDEALQLDGVPASEPELTYQWGLENTGAWSFFGINSKRGVDIKAPSAWSLATGAGVTVAVLDDGVDFSHPELAGQAWVNPGESGDGKETNGVDDDGNGYVDDVNGVNVCNDPHVGGTTQTLHVPGVDLHGTAVATVIAAAADGQGMVGVAPDARIMAVRFLIAGACETASYAVQAIDYAVHNGAKIINASWGGATRSAAIEAAIAAAREQGVLVVAAAGNGGSSRAHWPAASGEPNVLSVGAIRPDGQIAPFSNYGPWVDIAAPGFAILAADVSTDASGPVAFWSGTSFAVPHVAAIAALVAQAQPDLLGDPIALRARLITSGWRGGLSVVAKTAFGRIASARNALDFAPPALEALLTASARVGTEMEGRSVVGRLFWARATDDVGIDSYRVRIRHPGGAWSLVALGTSRTVLDRVLLIGQAYELEVAARDAGGNFTPIVVPVRLVRHEERTSLASYHGHWRSASSSAASNGHVRYSTHIGDSVTVSFTGRGIALVAPRGPSRGRARVFVDGTYLKTISLAATSVQERRVVFTKMWWTSGEHTVRFQLAGPTSRPRFDVDAFLLTP
jgi:thermitase